MGSPERFEDFKKRLDEAGLGYVDSEYLQAADPDRHLALVSRFPIVARNSRGDVPYELNGQPRESAARDSRCDRAGQSRLPTPPGRRAS